MRLSRAILVMLLLHIVAVGGILAFCLIKEHDAKRAFNDSASDGTGALEAEDPHVPVKANVNEAAHDRVDGANASARPGVHVVRAGETLKRIANENGVTLEALVAANGAKTATDHLRPGQELKLPDKSPEPSTELSASASDALALIEGKSNVDPGPRPPGPAPTVNNSHLPPDSGKIYVVGKGESPYSIAQKLKVNYEALLKLNKIDDPKKLKPGQKLHVPQGTKSK